MESRSMDIEGTSVAERVKSARVRQGLSQEDLAHISGTGVMTISGIENGRHRPRPSTLRKLANALGCRVQDLFPPVEGSDPKGPAAKEAA